MLLLTNASRMLANASWDDKIAQELNQFQVLFCENEHNCWKKSKTNITELFVCVTSPSTPSLTENRSHLKHECMEDAVGASFIISASKLN